MAATANRARLLQRIDAYAPHAWGVERLDTMGAHVLDTMTALSRALGAEPGQRKAIVALGPAGLFDTPIPPPTAGRDLRQEWVNAMQAMAAANVALYVIDPTGVGGSRTTGGESGFARETGGVAFTNTNNMTGVADRIMREAGTYYLIEVRDPPMDGRWICARLTCGCNGRGRHTSNGPRSLAGTLGRDRGVPSRESSPRARRHLGQCGACYRLPAGW